MSGASTRPSVIAEIVSVMRTLAGPHPGFRPVHAKGIVCTGTFQASPEARRVSLAPHFQGQSVQTIIRFSNSAGDPAVHDGLPNGRSLAVKFQMPGGKSADILANSIEGFIARTPEELLEFLDSPAGRRLRRIVGTGLILSIPLVMRLPWLRASPIGKLIEITGGAALLIKLAEVIRDWERDRPVPVVIDLPPAPPGRGVIAPA